jgi:hypothetical protein
MRAQPSRRVDGPTGALGLDRPDVVDSPILSSIASEPGRSSPSSVGQLEEADLEHAASEGESRLARSAAVHGRSERLV